MSGLWSRALVGAAVLAMIAPSVAAQVASRAPHIGYVYPAGGQTGTQVSVTLGGQFLTGAESVYVSGSGVDAKIVKHKRPLTNREANLLRDKIQKAREKATAERRAGKSGRGRVTNAVIAKYALEQGVTREQLDDLKEYRAQRSDPKRQLNPQLAERLFVELTIAADAAPGRREIRVTTPTGLTNPVWLDVGTLREHAEVEPNDPGLATDISAPLPMVVNGQILPGDVDRFSFRAKRGQQLVIVASARDLMPYLADAVPGWFQATLTLYDAAGREVAYDDDFEFHPDPVMYYRIPEDGKYILEIKDAIYRGREDFVYRITVGEIPFVTSVFPLGCQQGRPAAIALHGWNLDRDYLTFDATDAETGVQTVTIAEQKHGFNQVKLAVDALHDILEQEPNDSRAEAQLLRPPLIINGRIDRPGDFDVFQFVGREGGRIAVDVNARRLNSRLDSLLRLEDANGKVIAANDDSQDIGAGLITHQADSQLLATLPADGTYFIRIGDTQDQGGIDCAYRVRISARQPDFALRVTPSSVNARPGATVPITVHAVRRDGFDGDISLALRHAPLGFTLSGNWIPAGQDQARITVTIPRTARQQPERLDLVGRARVGDRMVSRTAVPADDMVQAFIIHHLVPASEFLINVSGTPRFQILAQRSRKKGAPSSPTLRSFGRTPIHLRSGGAVSVPLLRYAPPAVDRVELSLDADYDGIEIKKVKTALGGLAVRISTDGKKVKAGLKGNLIVQIYVRRSNTAKADKAKTPARSFPVGTLPAIPFEVVGAG